MKTTTAQGLLRNVAARCRVQAVKTRQRVVFTVYADYVSEKPEIGYIETIRNHLESALQTQNAKDHMNFKLRLKRGSRSENKDLRDLETALRAGFKP